jgi:hypothetical protein
VARRKEPRRPQPLSDAEIIEQLRANVYALLALQSASAKSTEDKFTQLPPAERREVKEKVQERIRRTFSELRPDQIDRQSQQKASRRKKN